ncbi:hypothetical protein RHAL1_00352 [Beijerinckiaceae bacterium RH AL1]|nr:cellulose biosynthesis protein BcsN [Beijerinckiaceae bacterium]VVB42726.1 hypothetical protein RHAL8_00332 [Beijerinckiaceae bacterium RH AL8]VVB42733.1 hypothetical protein RHCH11_RHCH11_00334 [Beijerinckiaceae bacterium RH CH11]VVC53471.1 hypothetical protein RHAL1_00352 [Beijerinckiaceae bacterium RH AL1]
MKRFKSRYIALAVVLLTVAGCVHEEDGGAASLEALAPTAAATGTSRPHAFVTLPSELGRMTAIHDSTFADGVRQEIVLDGGGAGLPRNTLIVLARTFSQPTLDDAVPLAKPTEGEIRGEISAAFPRVAMRVVERPSSNAYGPYGLAIGRAAGARCVFFWQWVDADRMPPDAAVKGPLSIRATLCRSGSSFDAIAAALDRLAVTRASDPTPALVVASVGREHRPRHPLVAARRKPEAVDAPIMHYQTIGAQRPREMAPALVSDLPPEALSGPRLASKQD